MMIVVVVNMTMTMAYGDDPDDNSDNKNADACGLAFHKGRVGRPTSNHRMHRLTNLHTDVCEPWAAHPIASGSIRLKVVWAIIQSQYVALSLMIRMMYGSPGRLCRKLWS